MECRLIAGHDWISDGGSLDLKMMLALMIDCLDLMENAAMLTALHEWVSPNRRWAFAMVVDRRTRGRLLPLSLKTMDHHRRSDKGCHGQVSVRVGLAKLLLARRRGCRNPWISSVVTRSEKMKLLLLSTALPVGSAGDNGAATGSGMKTLLPSASSISPASGLSTAVGKMIEH
ncbi:hypothetical protein ACLOJK_032866 [Asimina triloba]